MKSKNQEPVLTVSGHQYDRDLARVPIKVSPALQALVSNQLELLERLNVQLPDEKIFLENLKMELVQVEEEIASAFSDHMKKKEEQRIKRELKKSEREASVTASINNDFLKMDMGLPLEEDGHCQPGMVDVELSLDQTAEKLSPGLPSEKFQPRTMPEEKPVEIDVRRIAVGASIKALEKFLGRKLSEEEIAALEKQVEVYLN
ncbi:MAG: hypothetical protein ACOY35_12215 [Bacillota bacterium]